MDILAYLEPLMPYFDAAMAQIEPIMSYLKEYFLSLFGNMTILWAAILFWTVVGMMLVMVSQIRMRLGTRLLRKERKKRRAYVKARQQGPAPELQPQPTYATVAVHVLTPELVRVNMKEESA